MLRDTLGVKPILALKHGEIMPRNSANPRRGLYPYRAANRHHGEIEQIIVGESSSKAGQHLVEVLKAIYQGDIRLCQLGAALSTYTGPGTAAVAVITKKR